MFPKIFAAKVSTFSASVLAPKGFEIFVPNKFPVRFGECVTVWVSAFGSSALDPKGFATLFPKIFTAVFEGVTAWVSVFGASLLAPKVNRDFANGFCEVVTASVSVFAAKRLVRMLGPVVDA